MQIAFPGECIYVIRERKVMVDSDLAELYNVETRALKEAVQPGESAVETIPR